MQQPMIIEKIFKYILKASGTPLWVASGASANVSNLGSGEDELSLVELRKEKITSTIYCLNRKFVSLATEGMNSLSLVKLRSTRETGSNDISPAPKTFTYINLWFEGRDSD